MTTQTTKTLKCHKCQSEYQCQYATDPLDQPLDWLLEGQPYDHESNRCWACANTKTIVHLRVSSRAICAGNAQVTNTISYVPAYMDCWDKQHPDQICDCGRIGYAPYNNTSELSDTHRSQLHLRAERVDDLSIGQPLHIIEALQACLD